MANIRTLKKTMNYIIYELCTETLVAEILKKADPIKTDEILTDLLQLQQDFVSRVSHTEPGNVKGYYNQFYKDFNDRVDAIVAKIGAL